MDINEKLLLIFKAQLVLIITISNGASYAYHCPPSSCGSIHNISHPFRLTTDAADCGDYRFELACENNKTVLSSLIDIYKDLHAFDYNTGQTKPSGLYRYYVQAINHNNYTIRLVSPNVEKDNCSSVPTHPLNMYSILRYSKFGTEIKLTQKGGEIRFRNLTKTVTFLSCERKVVNKPTFIDTAPCIGDSSSPESRREIYSYVVVDGNLSFEDLEESCHIDLVTLISTRKAINDSNMFRSYGEIHDELAYGFELFWATDSVVDQCIEDCDTKSTSPEPSPFVITEKCGFLCKLWNRVQTFFKSAKVAIEIITIPPRVLSIIVVVTLLTYKWRSRHSSMYDNIEEFIANNNNLMPARYSYFNIIIITRAFREKLGEGGFGSVYKGVLSNGRLVAVKILSKSKSNGQDFINEVATIGRIHHTNVVQLIGFCFTRSQRALVYDFMPNGSLDNYIFRREGITKLISYPDMFDISLGVARGIDYLHRGCDIRILHFDIKPHNILLDDNFSPKVSDFGLARPCPLDNSKVNLTAARGTFGYIAPELIYKNIGPASQKSDVYSFGMLLMEMASRRKNLNAFADKSSQIYYPLWVYDQFNEVKEIEMENVGNDDLKTIKKMILVALWCIQLKPCDRPSMKKVVEMLESDVESLEMPPKPYLTPQEDNEEEKQRNAEEVREIPKATSLFNDEDSEEMSLISNVNPNL